MDKEMELTSMFKALSHPLRLQMVLKLTEGRANVAAIEKSLGIGQSNVSRHLSVLKNAGIVVGEREANEVFYKIIHEPTLDVIHLLYPESIKVEASA